MPRLPLSSYSLYSRPPVCGLFFINKDRQFDFPHWTEKSHLTSSFWHRLGFHLFCGLFFFFFWDVPLSRFMDALQRGLVIVLLSRGPSGEVNVYFQAVTCIF